MTSKSVPSSCSCDAHRRANFASGQLVLGNLKAPKTLGRRIALLFGYLFRTGRMILAVGIMNECKLCLSPLRFPQHSARAVGCSRMRIIRKTKLRKT